MSWVIIFGTLLVTYPIAFKMKKRLALSEIYSTVVFSLFIQSTVDIFANFRYKAWGFYEVDKVEYRALLIIIGIYPVFATMFINWFPYFQSAWRKILYLLGWSAFSTVYEWVTLKVGILWHSNWNLFYSFLLYPCIYYLLILHIKFFRRISDKKGAFHIN